MKIKWRMNIVVLSGAGTSAESGIKTFRDHDGLWEGHDVMAVASPQGWKADKALVLDFYNQRRRQLLEVEPNAAHHLIALLEDSHAVAVITQNVDDLHERAGSSNVLHLHGELLKARSAGNASYIVDCTEDITLGTLCPNGYQMRPHIVWFGEAVPMIERAVPYILNADCIIVIGTSLQVYPAAGLTDFADAHIPIYYIDPNPQNIQNLKYSHRVELVKEIASVGMQQVYSAILKK